MQNIYENRKLKINNHLVYKYAGVDINHQNKNRGTFL